MADRYYDIQLSCGCLVSLDGGGGLIFCYGDDCKFEEEYKLEWDKEIKRRNK